MIARCRDCGCYWDDEREWAQCPHEAIGTCLVPGCTVPAGSLCVRCSAGYNPAPTPLDTAIGIANGVALSVFAGAVIVAACWVLL